MPHSPLNSKGLRGHDDGVAKRSIAIAREVVQGPAARHSKNNIFEGKKPGGARLPRLHHPFGNPPPPQIANTHYRDLGENFKRTIRLVSPAILFMFRTYFPMFMPFSRPQNAIDRGSFDHLSTCKRIPPAIIHECFHRGINGYQFKRPRHRVCDRVMPTARKRCREGLLRIGSRPCPREMRE